jgi:hypothetical protein
VISFAGTSRLFVVVTFCDIDEKITWAKTESHKTKESHMVESVPTVVAQNLGSLADFNRAARKAAREYSHSRPVQIIAGNASPVEAGDGGRYLTRGGTEIRFPSAYRKKGRSNMVYHPSTSRVVVGANWRPEVW